MEATALMRRFREKKPGPGLRQSAPAGQGAGEERKCHCDRMVYEAVELLEELLHEGQ